MDRFHLTDDLLTGIDDIDAQHRLLFDLANQLVDPTSQRGADAVFFASLSFLSEYVQFHFAAEELAMMQTAYPEREQHCRFHAEFRRAIAAFLEVSLDAPTITELRLQLAAAVSDWLTDHIYVADKALAAHLSLYWGDEVATLPNIDALVEAGFLKSHSDWPQI